MPYLFKRLPTNPAPVEPEEFLLEFDGFEPIPLKKMGSVSIAEQQWFDYFIEKIEKLGDQPFSKYGITTYYIAYCLAMGEIRDWALSKSTSAKKIQQKLNQLAKDTVGRTIKVDAPAALFQKMFYEFWMKEVSGWQEKVNEPEGNDQGALPIGTEST